MRRNSVRPDDQLKGSDCRSKGFENQLERFEGRSQGKLEGSEGQSKRSDGQPGGSDDKTEGFKGHLEERGLGEGSEGQLEGSEV